MCRDYDVRQNKSSTFMQGGLYVASSIGIYICTTTRQYAPVIALERISVPNRGCNVTRGAEFGVVGSNT